MIQRPLRFGALFAGYGGLEDGVQSVIGGVLAWYSEYEPPSEKNPRPSQAAARIMAYHHPGVPNLGDITQIDWHKVAPVDVLTAAARTTGPARFYRLPPGEKRDVLAQAVARLYPTEGS